MSNQILNHMKRKTTFLAKAFMLFAVLFCFTGARAYEVEIGDGGETNSYLPGYNYYKYSLTQQIYTAAEIGMAGTINSIAFKNTGAEKTRTYSVYMLHTDKETFEGGTDWASMSDDDLVFTGELTFAVNEWTTITLDTPFAYDGTSNLIVGVADNTGNYSNSPHMACLVFEATSQAIRIYRDAEAYDVSAPGASGTVLNVKNQIVLDITPSGSTVVTAPSSIEATDVTINSAKLNWTGGTGVFNVEYKKATDTEWTRVLSTALLYTYTLTGLETDTKYQARVQSVDGSNVSTWKTVTFTTNTTKWVIGSGTSTNAYLPSRTYDKYSLTQQIYTADELGDASGIFSIDFYSTATERKRNLDIYMVSTDKASFESATDWVPVTASDLVFSGEVTFAQNAWTTITLDDAFAYDGTSNVILVVDDNTGTYVSNPTNFLVFDATAQAIYISSDGTDYDPTDPSSYSGNVIDVKNQIRLLKDEVPAVLKPRSLAVSYTGGTEAVVSWVSDEPSFDIEVNGTVTENVANPTTLTGLELATTYEVKVRAKNASGISDWTSPVSFTTDACLNPIVINYSLADSYGDGWTNNYILVIDEAEEVPYALTIESGSSKTGTIKICGSYARFEWYKGNYPGETSWTFTDAEGNELFSGTGNTDMVTGEVLYEIDNSPFKRPSDFTVTEIGPHSAQLSWTENGTATAWQICLDGDEDNLIDVTTNPYTLTGLDTETEYAVKVRAYYSSSEQSIWSKEVWFTTDIATPAPADVAAIPGSKNAKITWEAPYATSFELEHAEGSIYGTVLRYDDDTYISSIGNSTATTWTWGVMYPGELVTASTLDKVLIFESSSYNTEDITINIYQGGEDAPGTLLYTETITPEAADAFHEITLASPVAITPGENLWITLTEDGTYVIASCETTTPNNQWTYSNDSWSNIGDLSSDIADRGWMIRAEIHNNIDPASIAWTTITNVTSPYELTGLTPETIYTVRVKAIYGSEGESEWAFTCFKTLEAVPTPTDFAVIKVTNKSAFLSWTENGDATAWEFCLDDNEDNLIAATSNPFNLTGLVPDTDYKVKVRAVKNGGMKSRWSNEVEFTTDIATPTPMDMAVSNISDNAATVTWAGYADCYNLRYRVSREFITNFEDSSMGEWTTIDADGDGYTWVLGSAAGGVYLAEGGSLTGSGNNASHDLVISGSYSNATSTALTPDNYFVSPRIMLGGSITFWACAQDGGYPEEHFGVAVSTTGNTNAEDFTTIEEWTLNADGTGSQSSRRKAQGTWGEFTVDLSAYAGQEGYVAIRHFDCTDLFILDIDDIVITLPAKEEPWTYLYNLKEKRYNITGLLSNTTYQVQVQGVYAEGESEWAKESFTTSKYDPDGINLAPALSEGVGNWYDLSGRKLAGKPARKGIYVNDGRKVTIK